MSRESLEDLIRYGCEPVAIIGMGLRLPGDNGTPDGFAAFLRQGRSGVREVPEDRRRLDSERLFGGFLDDVDRFDAGFFNISPKEADHVDPQQRLMLETAWEALEDAGIDPAGLRHGDTGVFAGVTMFDYVFEAAGLAPSDVSGYLAPGLSHSAISGRLSYFLGLRGPSLTVDTTCSSSLAATHLAVQALRGRECAVAISGGVNVISHATGHRALKDGGVLAPDGRCKTFDDAADGYGRAEGCGVLVLKLLSDAFRDGDRVHGLIRGSALGQDGESAGFTAPNGAAQEQLMRAALDRSRLGPQDVQYVEAHGTGTALGDPIELRAIGEVFAAAPVVVASLKTNLGHLEGAAGVGSIIKTLLQLREGRVYPHLNLTQPSSRVPWDELAVTIPVDGGPWPAAEVRRALVNGFGITGTGVSMVLEQAPAPDSPEPAPEPGGHIFAISARTRSALTALARRYRAHVTAQPPADVAALCRSAATGRAHFTHRLAGLVREPADLLRLLDRHLAAAGDERRPARARVRVPKTAFMFTGAGSQYRGLGAALHRRYPVFRDVFDECDRLFAPLIGASVREVADGDDTAWLNDPRYAQPVLFTFELALARLWLSWGVRPAVLIGHSLGELVAATVAGLFPLPDAVRVVAERGRLSGTVTATGATVAVKAPAAEVRDWLAPYPNLIVGADNGPAQCLVTGAAQELAAFVRDLETRGVRNTPLAGGVPYHSPLMEAVADDFRAVLETVRFAAPTVALVSNVTGKIARGAELATADYWVRHLCQPVLFADDVRAVGRRGTHAFVEIGPSATLTAIARSCAPDPGHAWLSSTHREDRDGDTIRRSLAALYETGVAVSWSAYHRDTPRRPVDLPTYPFERRRYWLPTPRPDTAAAGVLHREAWLDVPSATAHRGTRRVLAIGAPAGLRSELPTDAESVAADDLAGVAAALKAGPFTDVCWFWRGDVPQADTVAGECGYNFRNLLAVLPVLAGHGLNGGRLWLVTEGAQRLSDGDREATGGAAATLWGFGRSLAAESPSLRATLADLPAAREPGALAALLDAEDAESELAWRAGGRRVRRIVRAQADPVRPVPPVRADRTYVIAGGLGRAGLAIARHLARLGAGHLVLLGRAADPEAPVPRVDGDARVSVRRCDVSDRAEVQRLLADLVGDPLPIAGFVVATGDHHDAAPAGQTWDALHETLRATVHGARVLDEAARSLPGIELFLLQSTASASVGSALQAGACAAGAYLDQLAASRAADGLPALCVSWGPWSPVEPAVAQAWRSQGVDLFGEREALDTLTTLLRSRDSRVTAVSCDWQRFAKYRAGSALLDELVARRAPGVPEKQDSPAATGAAPASTVNLRVRSCVADILRFPDAADLDPDADLVSLGLDSINAVEIRSALEREFRLTLPAGVTFDEPRIDLLSDFISKRLPHPASV